MHQLIPRQQPLADLLRQTAAARDASVSSHAKTSAPIATSACAAGRPLRPSPTTA